MSDIDDQGGLHIPVTQVRLCGKCGTEKRRYWRKRPQSKAGGEWIYVCQHCAYKQRVERNRQPHYSDTVKPPKPTELRYCKACNHKLFCSWHKDHRCKAGGTWVYRCLPCLHKRQMARDPDSYVGRHRSRTYGVTREQYKAMSAGQNDVCAICKQTQKRTRNGKPVELAVDHNHVTGKLRGLLCHNCNAALGLASDSPERLRAMADYLEYWQIQENEETQCPNKKTA